MNKAKLIMLLQTAACAALAAWLALSAVAIYLDGEAKRAADPMSPIYTRQLVAGRLAVALPLLLVCVGLTVAGRAMGARWTSKSQRGASGPVAYPPENPKRAAAIRASLLVAAVALIVAGALNGSAKDVLYKAINICTECIGLG